MNALGSLVESLLGAERVRLLLQDAVPGVARVRPLGLADADPRAAAQPERQGATSAPGTPAAAPAPAAAVSPAARALGAVLAQLPASPGPVQGTAPLQPQPPGHAVPLLARALAAAVSTSGLFYESHLAAVAEGALDPSTLDREPQARWALQGATPEGAAAPLPARLTSEPSSASSGHAPAGERPAAEAAAVAPQARALVAQQLELLAAGVFRWQGEAWPGVPMEWSLQEDRAQDPHGDAGAEARWSTTLSIGLPRLGRVTVHLALAGSRLATRLFANDAATARLRDAAGDLALRLSAAGFERPELAMHAGVQP